MNYNILFDEKEWKDICDRGIVNLGNHSRIKDIINRAIEGNMIKVGFIGGSITAGSLSSSPYTCYAYLVYSWWKNRFPTANIEYINAGIGATTSQLGVARVSEDLLSYDPDVVFVEFSVNDNDEEKYMETFEGLIRRILIHQSEPAVIIINNVCYDNGMNSQEIHNHVGKYYDLPIVSIKDSIYNEIDKGRIRADIITPDNLHPNDLGHRLVADVIINMLEKLYHCAIHNITKEEAYVIPKEPVTKNSYINAVLWNNLNIKPVLNGFIKDESEKEGLWDVFKQGWHGIKIGSRISFSVECCGLSVLYRKYAKKDGEEDEYAPIAKLVVDSNEEEAIILDSRFEEDWGDCLYLHDILKGKTLEKHLVEITIINQADGRGFYLASIITT